MSNKDRFILLIIAMAVVMLIAAAIEPCDGHSCTPAEEFSRGN